MAPKKKAIRCDMCWKDKPVEDLTDLGLQLGTKVCRGCKLDIDRIIGFLEKHEIGVQLALSTDEDSLNAAELMEEVRVGREVLDAREEAGMVGEPNGARRRSAKPPVASPTSAGE